MSMQTTPSERIEVLDIIRGFALFGILVVNMGYFSYPILYLEILGKTMWEGALDSFVSAIIHIFFEGKFYTAFSFLFGLGFVIFMDKAVQRCPKPRRLFLRRMLFLLILGLLHGFFIWFGDILATYAVLGFLLLLFYNRKPKTHVIWILIFFIMAILPTGLMVLGASVSDPEVFREQSGLFMQDIEQRADDSLIAYSKGSWSEVMTQRTMDTLFVYQFFFFGTVMVFPMFLLGSWAGKKKIFYHISDRLEWFKKVRNISLLIGLPMSLIKYYGMDNMDPFLPSVYDLLGIAGTVFGDTGLSVFYMSSIVILTQKETWKKILSPLANVGRMALTNYIMQSLICTMIFYSYGLGLYGQTGPASGLLLTVIIFVVQIHWSRWYFSRFEYGPLEKVWRRFTYLR